MRAVGANPLSPVATAANISVGVCAAVTVTAGLASVVALLPLASNRQVLPAAALPLAAYTAMVTPLPLGTANAWDPVSGDTLYHSSQVHSVTPWFVSAWVRDCPPRVGAPPVLAVVPAYTIATTNTSAFVPQV